MRVSSSVGSVAVVVAGKTVSRWAERRMTGLVCWEADCEDRMVGDESAEHGAPDPEVGNSAKALPAASM